jgi:restriction system protein
VLEAMITSKSPDTWQELQSEVGRLLEECGFKVEVEKKIATARGTVEVDVYAEEWIRGRTYSTVCECKRWKANVSQDIVHAFRTVMSDFGANIGYIVSIAGFQEGAYKAIEHTNVRLVTWIELQAQFEASWLEEYFSPTITERLDPLLSYTEPLLPRWFDALTEENQRAYLDLKEKYDEFGWLVMTFTTYSRMVRQHESFPALPVKAHLSAESPLLKKVPQAILEETHYREFLDAMTEFGLGVLQQFDVLRHSAIKGEQLGKANQP